MSVVGFAGLLLSKSTKAMADNPPAVSGGLQNWADGSPGKIKVAELCNGSTYDSDSYCWGSNPYSAATEKADKLKCLSAFFYQKFISRLRASPPPFSTNPFQYQVYSLTKYYKIGIAS